MEDRVVWSVSVTGCWAPFVTQCPHIVMVIYIKAQNRGSGLSPGPTPYHLQHKSNLNTFKNIWLIRNTVWTSGSPHSTKTRSQRGGPGFDPHGPHTILNNNQ
jgi:hypothetical protein